MRISCPKCNADSNKQSCLGKWSTGEEYRCDFCGHEYESYNMQQHGSYIENVLADIRNKLSPVSHLVCLMEEYMINDKMRSLEQIDYIRNAIIKQLPNAKESFEYIREYKLKENET